MKKFYLLTKTLLVAALLMVGANAWAVVTPVSQDYSSGVADWTSGNTGRYTVSVDGYLTVNAVGNGSNGATITGSTVSGKAASGDDFESSDDFTMIFDLQLTGANNGGNGHVSSFHIYDAANNASTSILSLNQTAASSTEWKINDASDKTVNLAKSTWYTFQLSKKGALLYLTVTPTAGGDAVFAQQAIAVKSSKGGLGNMVFMTDRYWAYLAIDNVVLRDWQSGDTPAGVSTTYTIQYRNESDVQIADDVVGNGMVDDVVSASAAQTVSKMYNEQKYIYKSGNNPITLVENAASNVITLVYRAAETYTYKVTSSLGTEIANSSNFEGEKVYVPYPRYELSAGSLYEAGRSDEWYRKNYTLTANVDETITYDDSSISNVVFYEEAENITGATATSAGNNMAVRSSNAQCGYTSSDLTLINLPAGNYKISGVMYSNSSGGLTLHFQLGDETYDPNVTGSSNWGEFSKIFTLASAADVKWLTSGDSKSALDYVYIQKLPDNVSATITSAGYATYCSPYALDFSEVSGLKAYIITGTESGNTLALSAVKEVPANTGVLLEGEVGNYDIPVVASSSTDVSANKLVGVTAKKEIAAEAGYVLMDEDAGVGFYKNNKAFTVGANTAYLPANFAGGAAREAYFFDGATDVEAVEAASEAVAKEGKFIVDGKLRIFSKGKMFNANGQLVK